MNNYYQKSIILKINNLIHRELKIFPQAQLVDIYKLFHQDYFGPGHFIADKERIISYLTAELNNISPSDDKPENQDIACFNNFVRVDIRWISQGILTVDELAEMFWKSSCVKLDQPIAWDVHWQQVSEIIFKEYPDYNLDNAEQISTYAQQEKALHHSEIYRLFYHPHYRIISKEFWSL
ncbi:MAG: hypothetical protein RAO94_02960 [Candidatus Stygibacter australis]|nr:hypothetical protein [Candidatus Stygibacter australis]MDP8321294.1 hypothetical protein [Candidatus Stygibacter australis]